MKVIFFIVSLSIGLSLSDVLAQADCSTVAREVASSVGAFSTEVALVPAKCKKNSRSPECPEYLEEAKEALDAVIKSHAKFVQACKTK